MTDTNDDRPVTYDKDGNVQSVGASGGSDTKVAYKEPSKTVIDPRTIQSAGAGAAGPQRKDFGDGMQGDADYSKALKRYRGTVAKGQAMAMSKDNGGSSTTP